MNSMFLISLMLLFFPYLPWILFSGFAGEAIAAGVKRVALYSALSQASLLLLRFAGPFSWASVIAALYLIVPFHLGILLGTDLSGVMGSWREKLAYVFVHLQLLVGQAGALLLAWS